MPNGRPVVANLNGDGVTSTPARGERGSTRVGAGGIGDPDPFGFSR